MHGLSCKNFSGGSDRSWITRRIVGMLLATVPPLFTGPHRYYVDALAFWLEFKKLDPTNVCSENAVKGYIHIQFNLLLSRGSRIYWK